MTKWGAPREIVLWTTICSIHQMELNGALGKTGSVELCLTLVEPCCRSKCRAFAKAHHAGVTQQGMCVPL